MARLAFLALAVLAAASAHADDFDASAALKTARAAAAADRSAVVATPVASARYDVDCANVLFGPDGRTASDPIYLQSREWIEQCYYEYPPGCDPRYNNCQPYYRCYERPGYIYQQTVKVALQSRQPLLPWEYDSFRVCLQGPWSDIRVNEAAYDYRQVAGGGRDGYFLLAPGQKVAMAPDPSGIYVESLSAGLVLSLKDKWASYYAGEKTALTIVVKKRNSGWFPKKIATLNVTLAPADAYRIALTDYAGQFSQQPEAGKDYFAIVTFQRIGKISTAEEMGAGETQTVTYQPGGTSVGK